MNLTESLVPRVLDTGMKATGTHYYSWLIYSSYEINSKQEHASNPSTRKSVKLDDEARNSSCWPA